MKASVNVDVSTTRPIILAFDALIMAVMVVMFFSASRGFNSNIAWLCLVIYYIMTFLSFIYPWNLLKRIPLTVTTQFVFTVFFYVIFYLPYQQHLLGILNYADSSRIPNAYPEQANRALIAATICYAAFQFGTLLFYTRPADAYPASPESPRRYQWIDVALPLVLLLASIGYVAAGFQPADTSRYQGSDFNGGPIADGLYVVILTLCLVVIARVILRLAEGRKITTFHVIGVFTVIGWAMHILIGGDRNNFLVIAVAAFGGFAALVRPIRFSTVLMAMLAAWMVYNVVEVARRAPKEGGVTAIFDQVQNEYGLQQDRESSFNNSTIALRVALGVVPAKEPFADGRFFLIGLAGIFPLARGMILGSNQQTTTSEIISDYALGQKATWGIGTTIISDIYINFGVTGMVLAPMFLGLMVGLIRRFIQTRGLTTKNTFLFVSVIGLVGEISRYTLHFPIRVMVWGIFILIIFELTLGVDRRFRRRSSEAA